MMALFLHKAFSLHKTLTGGLESCGLLVDVFISCLDSHSDGTHSLQRIHRYASDVLIICSDKEINSSTSRMAQGWVHFQQIFIFGWTIPVIFLKEQPQDQNKISIVELWIDGLQKNNKVNG